MAVIYRSVRVVVQNSSSALLTVEGAEVILGEWAAGNLVAAIPPQSAAAFSTQSTAMQTGSEAFVRFGSALGIVNLHWCLPWVGNFSIEHSIEGPWAVEFDVIDSDPCAIAALAILEPLRRGG